MQTRRILIAICALYLGSMTLLASPTSPAPPATVTARPLWFEQNGGQADARALYLARGKGFVALFGQDEVVLRGSANPRPVSVRMRFAGAQPSAAVTGEWPLPTKSYYAPRGFEGPLAVHATFARVRYASVYPGIDIVYYGNDGQLEFDLIVAAGADPSAIGMRLDGATDVTLASNGDLKFRLGGEEATLRRPTVYQESGHVRTEVGARYVLAATGEVGFAFGEYDRAQPLIVDPVFLFSSAGDDVIRGVETDSAGNVFLLAETSNASGFFWDVELPGSATPKCYLAKMAPGSPTPLYTILFGGASLCSTLAVSPAGVAYFPAYEGAIAPGLHVTSLISVNDMSGAPQIFRRHVGNYSPIRNQVGALAVDALENVYLLGLCRVVSPGQPPLTLSGFNDAPDAGSGQPTCVMGSTQEHVLLTKVAPNGDVAYATFLASDDVDGVAGAALAVDDFERVFVVRPRSAAAPVTPGAFRDACPAAECGYMVIADTTSVGPGSLLHATYLWPMSTSGRQVVRLGPMSSVYVGSEGPIDPAFPKTNFDPYPDFVPQEFAMEDAQLARFDFDGNAAAFRMARNINLLSSGALRDRLVDIRVLPSGAVLVGAVAESLDPVTGAERFDAEVMTYYRSGVLQTAQQPAFMALLEPNNSGGAAFEMTVANSGRLVTAVEQLSPAATSMDIRAEIGTANLDPGENTPPTLSVLPRHATIETYDPGGAVVPGYVAAFDWDETTNLPVGISDRCTHLYNIDRFPVGTTHVVCTPTDAAGLGIVDGYDVTVNLAVNTFAANTPIGLTDISGSPSNTFTPGRVTATFFGTVDGAQPGLTWLRTRTDQTPIGPPAGLQLGSAPFYYDIGTTAVTTGEINLCFDTTGMTFANNGVRLHQLIGSTWIDLAQTVDLAANQVCTVIADASDLGTFALFTPADPRTRVEILAGIGVYPGQWPQGLVDAGDGGPATAAGLSNPTAVAFDLPRQAMYIADRAHVRRVDLQTGIITRYAGLPYDAQAGGVFGNPVEGGLATNTSFLQIDDVAVDRDGNLFIAQAQNCVIQRIDRVTQIVRNVAGAWLGDQETSCAHTGDGGDARSAKINYPLRIAFDAEGNLFFGQMIALPQQLFTNSAGYIRRIAPGADHLIKGRSEETISTVAGNGTNTHVAGSPFASGMSPFTLAVGRSGEIYVGSIANILRIAPAPGNTTVDGAAGETLSIVAGGDPLARLPFQGDRRHPLDADLLGVSDLEIMPSGELLVSHSNTRRVRRISPGADGVVDGSADERITTLAGFAEVFMPPGPLDLSAYSPTDYALSAFFFPNSATVDPRGGIVVANGGRFYVQRFGYAASTLTVSGSALDFGNQLVGTTSSPRSITVTNETDNPLGVTAVSSTGDFVAVSACGVLAVGASCVVDVVFAPTALGPRTGELQITDSTMTVHRVSLGGRGRGLPAVQLAPGALTFANQVTGTTSAPQMVTLSNIGEGDLLISSVTIAGADFVLNNGCPNVLAPALSCAIHVSLRPVGTSAGLRTGELRVVSDAAGSPHLVTLTGYGDTRLLSISPSRVEFGAANIGATTAPAAVTLTNAGSTPIALGAIAVSGDTVAGVIDAFAGNGLIPTDFANPWNEGAPAVGEAIGQAQSIAVDRRGNVFFVAQSRVARIDATTRTINTIWKFGATAMVTDGGGPLLQPTALAVDRGGNVYVAEAVAGTRAARIRRIDAATGAITLVAGALLPPGSPRGDGGPAVAAVLEAVAIAVDGSGNVFIADDPVSSSSAFGSIRRVDAMTGIITRIAGGGAGNGDSGVPTSLIVSPSGVAVDAVGNVFIRDYAKAHIRRIDASTGLLDRFGSANVPAVSRSTVAVDPQGNVLVPNDGQLLRFDGVTAQHTVIAGSSTATQPGDGSPATAARISALHVAVDDGGNLYVIDGSGFASGVSPRIRRIEAVTLAVSSAFPITHSCGSTLDIGASCTVTVAFAPTAAGPQRAAITIPHDGTGAPAGVPVSGVGARPLAIVSPTLNPSSHPMRPLTFGNTVVGATTVRRVIVGNGGNAPLDLPATVFQLNALAPFTLQTGACGAFLPPGATCQATVLYSPATHGTHSGTLHVAYDSPAATLGILLDATAVPGLGISPTLLEFSTVTVGSAVTHSVMIAETQFVGLTSIAVHGADASEFELGPCLPARPAGFSGPWTCAVDVTFRPTGNGDRTAQLDIVGTLGFVATVPLRGRGGAFGTSQLMVTPGVVQFGAAPVGATVNRTVTLSNPGPLPVSISQISAGARPTPPGLFTIAGDGSDLGEVHDVAVDAAGNRYLADATRHRVWRVDGATGLVQAWAGTGVAGATQHPSDLALLSMLRGPTSVVASHSGVVYVADTDNHIVRAIHPSGSMLRVAGTGTPGYMGDGAHAVNATLNRPTGLAIDGQGNLLITDSFNHAIRRVDSVTGVITTVIGDGVAGSGLGSSSTDPLRLHTPVDVAVAPEGDLLVVDFANARVLRVEHPDGPNRRVTLLTPAVPGAVSVAIDAIGRVYVSDMTAHRVYSIGEGSATVAAGSGISGWLDSTDATSGRLSSPRGVAVDVTGHLFIADSGNRRLRQVNRVVMNTFGIFVAPPTTPCIRTLQVGESCDVDLAFTPSIKGVYAGTLQITHDAVVGPDTVPLAGIGTRGTVYIGQRPILLDVEVGTTATGTVRIANSGNGPLQVSNVTVTSTAVPNPFTSTHDCPSTLPPGAGCALQVTFSPTVPANDIGRVTVAHDGDPVIGPNTIFTRSIAARTQTTLGSFAATQSVFGEPITLLVGVTSPFGTPEGTVTFTSSGIAVPLPALTLAGGAATHTTTTLPAGAYALEARYGGSSLHAPSVSAPLAYSVSKQPTSTAVTATPLSLVYGQPLVLGATVSSVTGGAITGTVRFSDGSAALDPPVALVDASATTTIVPAVGAHSFGARYLGDANSQESSAAPLGVQVARATSATSVTTDSSPGFVGYPVTLTATVAPQYGSIATGTVTFRSWGTTLAVVPVTGNQAVLTRTFTSQQTLVITAVYSGDANVAPSTSTFLQQPIVRVPTTTTLSFTPNPVYAGQSLTITIAVTAARGALPDGQQVRLIGATTGPPIMLTLTGGTASFTTPSLPVGLRWLHATYLGNSTFAGSSDAKTVQVQRLPTTVVLTSTPNPSVYGRPVTFEARVTSPAGPLPDGERVTLAIAGLPQSSALLVGGVARFTTAATALNAGTRTAWASYAGSTTFTAGQSSALSHVVTPAPTTTTVSASAVQVNNLVRVTLTADVASAIPGVLPQGTVTFRRGTIVLSTVNLNNQGRAIYQTTSLPRGATHMITATYNPSSANLLSSTGSVSVAVP